MKQGDKHLIVHLVLHPRTHQVQNPWVAVLHLAIHHEKQSHGAGLHQHSKTLLGLEQIQFCALPFGDVVNHQHRLVGGGICGTCGFEMNGSPLLGDALKLHPRACEFPGTQPLPIPWIHQRQNVLANGQFFPTKKNGKLLVGVDDLVAFQKRNTLHGVTGKGSEALFAVADDLLVHHPFADVANLKQQRAVPHWNCLPFRIEC